MTELDKQSQNTYSYRNLLQVHFDARKLRNPRYSLRSFARDTGCSTSRLSLILNKKAGLSESMATTIAKNLSLSEPEANLFKISVLAEHSKAPRVKLDAQKRLKVIIASEGSYQIGLDKFSYISEWHHLGILELTKLKDFQSKPSWIANRLGVTQEIVENAIKRMHKLGLVTIIKGKLELIANDNRVGQNVSSQAIRSYHSQLLLKAVASLDQQSVFERHLSSTQIAVRKEDLPSLFDRIQSMRRAICDEFEVKESRAGDELYCVATQVFRLSAQIETMH